MHNKTQPVRGGQCPENGLLTRRRPNYHLKFRSNYITMENGCWEWMGRKDKDGYGRFSYGKSMGAHRAAWLLFVDLIPAGMCICHRCDNPSCVNPEHLFLGTVSDNMIDRSRKQRHSVKKNRKIPLMITWADSIRIRQLYLKNNIGIRQIAKMYNVSKTTINAILLGKTPPRYAESYLRYIQSLNPDIIAGNGEGI